MRSAQSTLSVPEVNQLASTGALGVAMAERHVEEHDPGEAGRDEQQRRRDELGRARADAPAEQARDEKAEERQEDDCLDTSALSPSSELMSSTAIEPRLRK